MQPADSPLNDPMRCLGRRYILEGLPEHRCPECGRTFEPHDERIFRRAGTRGAQPPDADLWLAAALASGVLSATAAAACSAPRLGFVGVASSAIVLVRSVLALLQRGPKAEFRGKWIAAIASSVFYIVSCVGIMSVIAVLRDLRGE